jgi:hypothetical protein
VSRLAPSHGQLLPPWLCAVLPADTVWVWSLAREVLPPSGYRIGGTAVAVHLRHRLSRDLDLCFEEPVDVDELIAAFAERAPTIVTERHTHATNLLVSHTKVQLLRPDGHHRIEPTARVEGLRIAGLGDLLAMKLQVVVDRPELRDYFDLMTIETCANRFAEEGLALFVERFRPDAAEQAIATIVRYLADLTDVPDDPTLPASREQIVRYWHRRVPEIVRNLDRG